MRWRLALARNQSSGVVCCWERGDNELVAHFSEKSVFGSRVLVRAWLQCVGGLLWPETSIRGSCVGVGLVALRWWPTLARNQFAGVFVGEGVGTVLVGEKSKIYGVFFK